MNKRKKECINKVKNIQINVRINKYSNKII